MTIDQSFSGGDTNPTSGANDGSNGADGGQADASGQQQNPSGERTYTQRDWDSQFAAARRSWEYQSQRERQAAVDAVRQEYERRLAAGQSPAQAQAGAQASAKFDPTVDSALKAWFQENYGQTLNQFREGQVKAEVQLGLGQFQSRHPELTPEQVNDVLEAATKFGDAVMNATPMDKLMDMAFLQWKYGSFDEKKFKQEAIDEYVKTKTKTAAVPRPQGSGNGVVAQKRAKDFSTADSVFENMLRESEQNG